MVARTDMPALSTAAVACYINKFVSWDSRLERWASPADPAAKERKIAEAQDVLLFDVTHDEKEFLVLVESDPQVRSIFRRLKVSNVD